MKINSGLLFFTILFLMVIAASIALGSYDTITPAVTRGKMELSIGNGWTTGISAAFNWIFKLAVGGIFTGFGWAAFNEARKAYKLWKRSAQAGRWQGGPNAQWQKSAPSTPKFNKQDMLLMALSGRLPQAERPSISYQPAQDEDGLGIEM